MSEQTNNHLVIGGCDAVDLAERYGTPTIVYDVAAIRQQIQAFKRVFESRGVAYSVNYASKAFSTVAMYQVLAEEDCHADVVSGGELHTALTAGFPMTHIGFNGNNKSRDELIMALDAGVATLIVDSFREIDLLAELLPARQQTVDVLLRITPGVSAHTHEFISTGQVDSKFGFDLGSGQVTEAFQRVQKNPFIHLRGVHAHIGSQIFDTKGFVVAAEKLMQVLHDWQTTAEYVPEVINVGGGFGIQYTTADEPIAPEVFVAALVDRITELATDYAMPMPEIWIEPGRSLVGPAGTTLYRVGATKEVPDHDNYVAVDGGMGDNIRPALYDADYTVLLASNTAAPATQTVNIAGKYCESGDILAKHKALPDVHPDDIVAFLATGAYGYVMASNYNRNPRPAVVFVENGQAQVVVARETYADLVAQDRPYQRPAEQD